jgi:Tol biopolymer transport system component
VAFTSYRPASASRRLTNATMPATDRDPAFAPEGRRLAYVACRSSGFAACDVMIVDLDAELTVRGAPRRLTSIASHIMGVAWVRDGKSIIFGTQAVAGVYYLWRVESEGRHAAERLELPGLGAAFPATVPSRDRLAFVRHGDNVDVYRVEAGGRLAPLVTSTFGDFQAVFSPDGRRLAFCSSRTGESVEIWVAAADGSGAQLRFNEDGDFSVYRRLESGHFSSTRGAADPERHRQHLDAREPRSLTVDVSPDARKKRKRSKSVLGSFSSIG